MPTIIHSYQVCTRTLDLPLIKYFGLIVPEPLRADWQMEWEAELRFRPTPPARRQYSIEHHEHQLAPPSRDFWLNSV